MKFFMYGVNMLLRDENDGDGNDLGGTGDDTSTDDKSGESKSPEEIKAAEEAAAAEKAEADKSKSPEEIKAAEEAAAAEKAEADKGKSPEEIKAAEEAAAAEKAEADKGEGAPEKYEAFTLDENYEGIIDDAAMESFSEVARDLNLSQVDAQKLVDYEVQRQEQMFDAYTEQTEQWKEEVKTDKEIGGADHDLKLAKVAKAYKALATDEFSTLMNPYHPVDNPKGLGLGNHPEVVRLFYRIGLKMSEDGFVSSDVGGESKLERETVLYGSGNKDK